MTVLLGVGVGGVGDDAVGLEAGAEVHQEGGVAAVVEEHVRADDLADLVAELEQALGAPPVLLQRLALPGEDRDAGGLLGGAVADDDRRGGVVLGGEDVAADPADVGAERGQRLDEDGGLHGHVQRAGDAGAGERLGVAVLGAQRHQAGHLVLGELDLLAAEAGEGEVGDLEVDANALLIVREILRRG